MLQIYWRAVHPNALLAAPRAMMRARRLSSFVVRDEVRAAVACGRPVVALESTIITHGMPFPRNLEVARACEAAVRARGAVPATVAVLAGAVRVGLADAELEALAASGRAGAATKCSRRDLGWAVQRTRADPAAAGATTVAATAWAARKAGIHVFATGGLGGVHRGASETWDVSADLDELGRTRILVVCGGVKSILDVPKTLEALETRGVAVAAFGTSDFPAFLALRSPGADGETPNRVPLRVDSAAECAAWFGAHLELDLASSCVLAVPNPAPLDADEVEAATRDALAAARARGVTGAAATPFLLAELERRTAGASLDANVALVLHNVAVAADVAAALARPPRAAAVVVVGAAAIDVVARASSHAPGASTPGVVEIVRGGVGANIARAASKGASTALLATADAATLASLAAGGVDVRGCAVVDAAPTYVALHGADGDLVGGVFDGAAGAAAWDAAGVAGAAVVVVDANLENGTYATLLAHLDAATELWFEPTSAAKAAAAFAEIRHRCDVVTPNEAELGALLRACGRAPSGSFEGDASALARRADAAVVGTRGAHGAVLATPDGAVVALPAEPVEGGLTNGAGDAFCGAAAAARAAGRSLEEACRAGAAAAGRVVRGADPPPGVVVT